MNSPKLLLLILSLLLYGACGSALRQSSNPGMAERADQVSSGNKAEPATAPAQVSLQQADQSQSIAEAVDRKIIRDANLTLEVDSPGDAQRKVTSIAESVGGFVVTSESKRQQYADTSTPGLEVTLVVRVPASQFGPVLDQIRAIGRPGDQEKITGGRH